VFQDAEMELAMKQQEKASHHLIGTPQAHYGLSRYDRPLGYTT